MLDPEARSAVHPLGTTVVIHCDRAIDLSLANELRDAVRMSSTGEVSVLRVDSSCRLALGEPAADGSRDGRLQIAIEPAEQEELDPAHERRRAILARAAQMQRNAIEVRRRATALRKPWPADG
jgi:hypothetical protein